MRQLLFLLLLVFPTYIFAQTNGEEKPDTPVKVPIPIIVGDTGSSDPRTPIVPLEAWLCNDEVSVTALLLVDNITLSVYNEMGCLVNTVYTSLSSNQTTSLSLADSMPGNYLLTITMSDGGVYYGEFLIEKPIGRVKYALL
jgi:hypothetical protein